MKTDVEHIEQERVGVFKNTNTSELKNFKHQRDLFARNKQKQQALHERINSLEIEIDFLRNTIMDLLEKNNK